MKTDLTSVLARVRPTKKEEEEMENFTEKLLATASKLKNVKPMLCGSIEKDTWLAEKNEVDLFLLFNPSVPKKHLEKKGLEMAKWIIKSMKGRFVIAYAEHPYLRGKIGKFSVDIVPCYDIANPEKIQSAVDRTPHHVRFVKANLQNPDDVRLLKQFCKVNGCYGADLKTQGFSGYICELLIIKYGSFLNLVGEASKWRAGHAISFRDAQDVKKFRSPLVVVDPVDRNRNVGAALSAESFYRFVKACKDFAERPSKEYFSRQESKPYSIKEISKEFEKRGTRWYLISFDRPDVLDDILYPQLRRCVKAIDKLLEQNGFKVLRSDSYCNKECVLAFEMEIWQVPRIMKNVGPDIYSKHSEQFLRHYKENIVFIEGENWVVETQREFTTVLHFMQKLLKNSEKVLLEKGIPSKIAPMMRKCRLYGGEDALKAVKKLPAEFRVFLKEWFEKDLNVV
jgi:tRNA nucleotidyltransferase (CCA-adding enzyme)